MAREEVGAAADAREAAEAKATDAVNRHARLQADWENYRRRTAQERLDERARATDKLKYDKAAADLSEAR